MIDVTKALLEAGDVQRLHTHPHHRHYDIAQHSWRMAALLYTLWPQGAPPATLLFAVLFHDCAERYIGDVPAPTKWTNPDLDVLLTKAEARVNAQLGIHFTLSPKEQQWLHALDLLELYLYCEQERLLGSVCMGDMMEVCRAKFKEWGKKVPDEVRGYLEAHTTTRTRTEELFHDPNLA